MIGPIFLSKCGRALNIQKFGYEFFQKALFDSLHLVFTRRRTTPVVARQGPAGGAGEVAAGVVAGVVEEGAEEMAAEVVAEEVTEAGDAETEQTGTA